MAKDTVNHRILTYCLNSKATTIYHFINVIIIIVFVLIRMLILHQQ
jgi:hypothetical protein